MNQLYIGSFLDDFYSFLLDFAVPSSPIRTPPGLAPTPLKLPLGDA